MNWIDPRKVRPQEGKIYIILFQEQNTEFYCIGFAKAQYDIRMKWNEKSDSWEDYKTDIFLWKSIYHPTKVRGIRLTSENNSYGEFNVEFPIDKIEYYIDPLQIELPVLPAVRSCKCKE